MFRAANGGVEFFREDPMSSRAPATGALQLTWVEDCGYFRMDVPEGRPGSNPGDLSRDDRLDIVTVAGPIPGHQP